MQHALRHVQPITPPFLTARAPLYYKSPHPLETSGRMVRAVYLFIINNVYLIVTVSLVYYKISWFLYKY
jgi:hypothetical protein